MIRRWRRMREANAGSLSLLGLVTLELLAIVVAIVLGFMINQWREQRARAEVADVALHALAQEMDYNHKQIVHTYEYFSHILGRIRAYREANPDADHSKAYGHQLEGWRGAMPPMLRSSAFQTMVSTGSIADLPFEDAAALAQTYNLQRVVERLDDAFLVKAMNDSGFARLETIYHLFTVYTEVMPMVIASYQYLARPILAKHGYDLEIENATLREKAGWQMRGLAEMTRGKPTSD